MGKYIKRKINLHDYEADFFCNEYGFSSEIAGIIASKGVTKENAEEYFSPTKASFHDPFLMYGLREAVEEINKFSKSRILIYGDYDCDGITAAAILKLYFDSVGIRSRVLLPSRDDGYGLHYSLVEKAYFEEAFELVITVDCGISAHTDIKKIVDNLGVSVVVTDHHNPPDRLPDCICVNPKLGYPYPHLCGAGVALKVVQALGGYETSTKYFALAAVGTAGDVCPLSGENRAIVKLGLQNVSHRGLIKLAESARCHDPLKYSDLSMRICPRINSAGRISSPQIALKVCLSDKSARESDIQSLNQMNEERAALQKELMLEIEEELSKKILGKRNSIVLKGDKWHKGILGITASRIKELYNMPAFVFRRSGNVYIGSARSIEGVDIFSAAKGLTSILDYGGHSLGMGLTVEADKFDIFCEEIDSALSSHRELILDRSYYYDLEFNADYISEDFQEKLELLEPFDEILYHIRTHSVKAAAFGSEARSVRILTEDFDLKGFSSYADYLPALKAGAEFEAVFTIEYDSYQRKYAGIIKSLTVLNSLHFEEIYAQNYFLRAKHSKDSFSVCANPPADADLIVLNSYEEYEALSKTTDLAAYSVDFFKRRRPVGKSILISPAEYLDADFSFELPLPLKGTRAIKALCADIPPYMKRKITHKDCAEVFRKISKGINGNPGAFFTAANFSDIDYTSFLIILRVFEELGFIRLSINPFRVSIVESAKRSLSESEIFNLMNG